MTQILLALLLLQCFANLRLYLGAAVDLATIDDATAGDGNASIDYQPGYLWDAGPDCLTRQDKPCTNPPRAPHNNTWHQTSVPMGITGQVSVNITFTGTELYVYTILIPNTATVYQFTMDGKPSGGVYQYVSDQSGNFQYDILVYNITNLNDSQHIFTLSPGRATASLNGMTTNTLVFDYARYAPGTLPQPSTSPNESDSPGDSPPSASPTHHKQNVGAIAGGVVGAIAALVIFALIIMYARKRRRSMHDDAVKFGGRDPSPLGHLSTQPPQTRQAYTGYPHVNPSTLTGGAGGSGFGAERGAVPFTPHQLYAGTGSAGMAGSITSGTAVASSTSSPDRENVHERIAHIEQMLGRLVSGGAIGGPGSFSEARSYTPTLASGSGSGSKSIAKKDQFTIRNTTLDDKYDADAQGAQDKTALNEQIRALQDEIQYLRTREREREEEERAVSRPMPAPTGGVRSDERSEMLPEYMSMAPVYR